MDSLTVLVWYQIVGAVIAGNVLFGMLFLFWWTVDKNVKSGRDMYAMPIGVAICGFVPPVLVALGLYLAI